MLRKKTSKKRGFSLKDIATTNLKSRKGLAEFDPDSRLKKSELVAQGVGFPELEASFIPGIARYGWGSELVGVPD